MTFKSYRVLAAAKSACAIAILGCLPLAAQPTNNLTLIEVPPMAGPFSRAYSINGSGQVTGYSTGSNNSIRAFLYSSSGLVEVATTGGNASQGFDINNSGQVVGVWDYDRRAFVYSNGSISDLGTLGGIRSGAYGINNLGHVVGFSTTAGNVSTHAFVYANGVMTDLGTLGPRDGHSTAFAINDFGQVTGSAAIPSAQGPPYSQNAFLYQPGAGMRNLGTLGGRESGGRDINNAGDVVGSSTTASGFNHAFLYSGGVMRDLGTLVPGSNAASAALGINNKGQVVGWSGTPGSNELERHAFIYDNGTMYDLNSFFAGILSDGTKPGFTRLVSANSINDSGYITGDAYYCISDVYTPIPDALANVGTDTLEQGMELLAKAGSLEVSSQGFQVLHASATAAAKSANSSASCGAIPSVTAEYANSASSLSTSERHGVGFMVKNESGIRFEERIPSRMTGRA